LVEKEKNMFRRALIPLVALAFTAAVSAAPPRGAAPAAPPSQAQHARAAVGPGELLSPEDLATLLALTDTQKTQIQTLRDAVRTTVEPLREQQRANNEKLRAAVEAGNAAEAGALLIANKTLADQIRTAHESFATAFNALLTPAQQAKFAVYREIVELRRD
jgi:Spy/CpxP family protein refolding chaperone